VVKLQLPPLIVAAPRSVAPSNTCTDDRFASPTVPDSARVLSLVTTAARDRRGGAVSVPIVLLIVSLGMVVVDRTRGHRRGSRDVAGRVGRLAVKLWLPSGSGPVVKLQLPPLIVAAPRSVAPSNTCTDDRLASPTVPTVPACCPWSTPPLEIVVVAPVVGADRAADRLARIGGVRPSRSPPRWS